MSPSAEPERAAERRSVPAPELRETADIWFDDGADPLVTWDEAGLEFLLASGTGSGSLVLWRARGPVADPRCVAAALAEGLAACDFPPTGDGASPAHVAAALRAAGLDP